MEHVDDFERLTRKLDAYHELLEFGHAERRVDDPEAWRREIRRQARLDRVRVRTFADGCYVGALKLGEVTDERMRDPMRTLRRAPVRADRSASGRWRGVRGVL